MVLLAYAAPREGEGVAAALVGRHDVQLVEVGVGKTSAASRLTERLLRGPACEYVVLLGVAGAHRGAGLSVGDVCMVAEDQLADEGVETPQGFVALDALRLGSVGPFLPDQLRTQAWAQDLSLPVVRAATVSRCSGTNASAEALAQRTRTAIETMENAALAWVCTRWGVPWIGVRAISNYTGDRDEQAWRFDAALDRLTAAIVTQLSKA
ncbi:MAG: futalosine hydrolase [Myxococcales bacterium FL481]|nr:MAG: futalosine hydrolase [Myxococcales bacterium FL481]